MITDLLKRSICTGIKLPFAIAWDCISLGNVGDGASTTKVIREHRRQKQLDEALELARRVKELESRK